MSWSLKGSSVETCSCELMCPCNLSFDHGGTYDYCRVTLIFNIREREIEGTDVAGLKVSAIEVTDDSVHGDNSASFIRRIRLCLEPRASSAPGNGRVRARG